MLTIPVTDTQVSFSGTTTVTINPTADLDDRGNKTYAVTIDTGAIADVQDIDYAGGPLTWHRHVDRADSHGVPTMLVATECPLSWHSRAPALGHLLIVAL